MKRDNSISSNKFRYVIYALLAALFYAFNAPISKVLLDDVDPTFMASFLYLGAGIGVSFMYLYRYQSENKDDRLKRGDLLYTVLMVVLDIIAPIFLMIGIKNSNASSASLLSNFELVATTIIAFLIFKEKISGKLLIAISLITIASILLSFDPSSSFKLSIGSVFVLLASICWGIENNCTRNISSKSTYQIVTIKGLCCGISSLIIAFIIGKRLPDIRYVVIALLLGFVAYGLSIFVYVRAQNGLGAAKTSAYHALAPFISLILSFFINKERLNPLFFIALLVMIIGTIFTIKDTLESQKT